MRTAPLSLDEIETLGELLASTPEPAVPMEPDMLDGYLTAIALMKKPPRIDRWLAFVTDINGVSRAHCPDELRHLVLRRGAQLQDSILKEKPIDPILFTDEESDDMFADIRPFSDGFLFACCHWPELLENKTRAVQAALVGILRYANIEKEDEVSHSLLASIDTEIPFANLDEALADIEACVGEIAEVTRLGR